MSNPYKNRPNNTNITNTTITGTSNGQIIAIEVVNSLAIKRTHDDKLTTKEFARIAGNTGVQANADVGKALAMADKRHEKAAKRNSVETIKALTNRIAALEATVARLVNCYPLCSITPTPTITRTVTPTVTPTKSRTPTPTVTPSRFPSEFVTPTPDPTQTPSPSMPMPSPSMPMPSPGNTPTPTPSPSMPMPSPGNTPTPTPSPSDPNSAI